MWPHKELIKTCESWSIYTDKLETQLPTQWSFWLFCFQTAPKRITLAIRSNLDSAVVGAAVFPVSTSSIQEGPHFSAEGNEESPFSTNYPEQSDFTVSCLGPRVTVSHEGEKGGFHCQAAPIWLEGVLLFSVQGQSVSYPSQTFLE